jgi:pyridoxine 5-phosphate synthase
VTKLSVNINKIATIRNARGGNIPNVVEAAIQIERFGADGITVHPRPDGRHIRYDDVYELKKVITTEFNVEGFPDADFMDLVLEVKPDQVTLVPDSPHVLTSNAGWDTINQQAYLTEIVQKLKSNGMRVSLFIDPLPERIIAAKETGSDRIEFYTEAYASQFDSSPEDAIRPYISAAMVANEVGLGINAGHDLNLKNLAYFNRMIPDLLEVSIGHALISDALYLGLEETVKRYQGLLMK